MHKRIIALWLCLCLVFLAVPVLAGAATAQQVVANAATVTAGNSVTVTLRAENFTDIATLEVYVYYDSSALTLSSTGNGSLLSALRSPLSPLRSQFSTLNSQLCTMRCALCTFSTAR
jgi:hypothetical protein